MTEAEIAHAKSRAEDVVNGFTKVKTQQARDVVKLANELQEANRKLDALSKPKESKTAEMPGFFDQIFKGKK